MDVETGYRRWSPMYDAVENRTRDLDGVVLRETALVREDRDIVEVGCGSGKNTEWLADGARSLVALDLSEEMLAFARRRVTDERVRFVRHDLRTPWPLDAGVADLVIGNLVLEHICDVGFIFAEAARVLRADGELYVCEFHPFRQLSGGGARLSEADEDRIETYVHSVSEYVNAAISAGFTIAHVGEFCDRDGDSNAALPAPRLLVLNARMRT